MKFSKPLLSWLVVSTLVFSVPLSAELGEDGVESTLDSNDHRANWTLGVIEPAVDNDAQTESELDVIIYLNNVDDNDTALDVKDVSDGHKANIALLSQQLSELTAVANPSGTALSEDEEKDVIQQQADANGANISQRKAVAEQLDNALNAMRQDVHTQLYASSLQALDAVSTLIVSLGGTVNGSIAISNALHASIPASALQTLANHAQVHTIMKNRPTDYELNVSVEALNYDSWWDDSIDGGLFDFGIPEGVEDSHPAFSGATFCARTGSTATEHGTHVTGIVASADSTYRGGAYGLDKIIWANVGSGQGGTMSNMQWMNGACGDSPEVVNHSLGYGTITTDYNTNDGFYDAYVQQFSAQVTKSAGNGGWGSTNTTMTHPATAYNIMAVANMDDQNTLTRTDDVRRSSSSTGPTPGGRKKPDISAPGTNIRSTNDNWQTIFNPDFIDLTGTSMAAPHVAAAVILLQDGGNTNPMSQKAVLINTADAWDSNNTSSTADDTSLPGSHWDKSYGWGYLDMNEAHFNKDDYFVDFVVARNDNAVDNDYKLYKGTMFNNEKATMVWNKRATGFISGQAPTTTYALTDINMRLYDEADGSNVDSDTDSNDNVHQVANDSGGTIQSVIKTYAWSSSIAGSSSEQYALATEENFTKADPPAFTITSSAPSVITTGTNFTMSVTVNNTGDVASFNNNVSLTLPSDFSIVSGANPQNVGTINDGSSQVATWVIKAGSSLGTGFDIDITNSSDSYLETYTGTDSHSIDVLGVPAVPIQQAPSGDIGETNPTYKWDAAANATSYRLYVIKDGTSGAYINEVYTAAESGCAGSTGCSITPTTSLTVDGYRWWVRGENAAGVGNYAGPVNFSLVAPPSATTTISPTGTITDTTPTYIWNAAATATHYQLFVNDSTGNVISSVYSANAVGCSSGTGTCSYTHATALAAGAGNWWIRARNAAGYGNWSSARSFTVSASVPSATTLVTPNGAITDTTPTYTWDAEPNSTWYYLWVNDSTGNVILQWYTKGQAGCSSGTGTCSVTPTTALASGSGTWWIRTYNDAGDGPWSAGMSFSVGTNSTPPATTLVSPNGAITDNTPTYTWNAEPNSTWYYLWVNDSTGNVVLQWYTKGQAGCSSGTGTCSVTPTTTLANGAGTWWVRTYNDAGDGPWTAGMNFTVN